MKYKVPFIQPSFPDSKEIAQDIDDIVSANWYTNFGPYESKFRADVSVYLDESIGVCTVANATLALDIAAKALLDTKTAKKKVIIPAFTFAAGGNVILMNGFEPLFIDLNKEWQPDISQASELLKVRADEIAGILLCNIFGVGGSEVARWEELAKEYRLPLIIDSAAGFGSRYPWGEKLGGRGDCEIFSLHATKPFSVGEGGLITSKNKQLIDVCRSLTNFGFGADRKVHALGTNAKLNEISSAIGIRQLTNLDTKLASRRLSFDLYRRDLESAGYEFQFNGENSTIAFVSVVAPTPQIAKRALELLKDSSIEAKQYYDPLNRQPLFGQYLQDSCTLKMTNDIADRIICLPLHDLMDPATISRITRLILSISD